MSDRVLRKRAAPASAPEPPAKKKAEAKPKKSVVDTVKDGIAKAEKSVKAAVGGSAATNGAGTGSKVPEVGDSVDIATFGGEVETNDGEKVTLSKLLEESKAGVVLFTYPKASTPGWYATHLQMIPLFPLLCRENLTANLTSSIAQPKPASSATVTLPLPPPASPSTVSRATRPRLIPLLRPSSPCRTRCYATQLTH